MLVDLLIILIIVYAVVRNWSAGFISQFFSAVGLIVGLFIGRAAETYTISLVHTPSNRAIVTIITILGLGLIGLALGEFIGLSLKHRLTIKIVNSVDNLLGSIITVITMLIIVWLTASVIQHLPATKLKSYVNQSSIIAVLNRIMPPAPNVISDLGKVIDPNGFPDVFIGQEPILNNNVHLPSLGSLSNAVNADRLSVVRIEGQGCGGIVTGSGFVVGPGLVATNAHVVAGIRYPLVDDVRGSHPAKVIWFDPNLDLAVLRVGDLAGKPLKLDLNTINPGTPGVVLGYPGGGPFSAAPAAVMDEFNASGHNIYGSGVTLRQVYAIKAKVIPGNSGGPLINAGGQVIGVVFAQSTTYNRVGYALAIPKVNSEINAAKDKTNPVSTGQCAE